MSETAHLADQIHRAFDGEAWHGDSVLEILNGVNAQMAAAHPIKNAHSIWELVLHISAWDGAILERIGGAAAELQDEQNFPPVKDTSETAWHKAIEHAKHTHDELVKAVAAFPDSRLHERVPGKTESYHDFFYTFSGIVQHELYHAGQIALLKKAQAR
ncbi:MAG TPA: DinB family protein [Terriglobales bacterium]|nr:DinB family protein [Terriglobales bacterium]